MSGSIYYFSTAKHTYAFGIYASFYAKKPAEHLRMIPYVALQLVRAFEPGAFIFTDHDRLPEIYRQRLARLADRLAERGCQILNHPLHVLQRFALLRALHEAGLNDFNVHWLTDWREVRRFPVFIRRESGHDAPVTGLLADEAELRTEAERLLMDENRPDDLMIVEFGNARGEDGRYRKYSAYRVGSTIYPQHCFSSDDWWIKFGGADLTPEEKQEHIAYLRDNPHREQLERVFAVAGIEYGRVDYCVVEGRVQAFEINTNPTVIQGAAGGLADLSLYVRLHDDALMRLLDGPSGSDAVPNPLFAGTRAEMTPEALHDKVMSEFRSRGRKVRVPADSSLSEIGPQ